MPEPSSLSALKCQLFIRAVWHCPPLRCPGAAGGVWWLRAAINHPGGWSWPWATRRVRESQQIPWSERRSYCFSTGNWIQIEIFFSRTSFSAWSSLERKRGKGETWQQNKCRDIDGKFLPSVIKMVMSLGELSFFRCSLEENHRIIIES